MNKRSFIFIVNPVSGTGKQKGIEKTIAAVAGSYQVKTEILFTQYAGHAFEMAQAYSGRAEVIVAVGGDGSVNEVGRALVHTPAVLGIVPMGSGNGLARHLSIPLNPARAIENVFTAPTIRMDIGKLEDHVFLSTAGFGFDAQVAHQFAQQKKRGFRTYIKTVRKELFRFQPFEFTVKNQDRHITGQAFMLSVANIPQFGNNFSINPLAAESDGLLNATIIKPFPRYKIPGMLTRFFSEKVHKSKYFNELTGREFTLELPHLLAHVDGEPVMLKNKTVVCTVDQNCLQIIKGK